MTQGDFTRFGRNSIEVGYFMEMVFPLYGVRFISINDEFDSDKLHGDTGGINVAFKYLVSEFYSGHDISRCCGIWSTSAVVHILDDERYTGTYIIGKREVTEVGGHRVRMKDESQWIKIPDHHPGIISRELFEQAQAQRTRFKCPKKKANAYPLRGKVFCGCCRHAMPRTSNKNHSFRCRYTRIDETAACHGLTIAEAELETMLYEVLSRQAHYFECGRPR